MPKDAPNYMASTVSSEEKRSAKSVSAESANTPWVPSGAATRTLSGQSMGSGISHNVIGQKQSEMREAKQSNLGSMESTVFDGSPRAATKKRFKGIENVGGQPTFAAAETKKGIQRAYFSLDGPGMGSGRKDDRMNRHEVSAQYRQSYVAQQHEKGSIVKEIPATFHADVSLTLTRSIERTAIPQEGAKKVQNFRNLDQISDGHKYRSSYGITPGSFKSLSETIVPGSEKLTTASRDGRKELSKHYSPGTVVHPSELRSPSEQTELRQRSRSMSPIGNVGRKE